MRRPDSHTGDGEEGLGGGDAELVAAGEVAVGDAVAEL